MPIRDIIIIDEEKCDGCGKCISACHEGAIALVDGKARLVKEDYCDGLGDCIGECPQGAITIERRDAPAFVEPELQQEHSGHKRPDNCECENKEQATEKFQCPGSMAKTLQVSQSLIDSNVNDKSKNAIGKTNSASSQLSNWPVQLKLVPVNAPYLKGARLLIAADCVCCAFPEFHSRLLQDKILIIACPKLDDANFYVDKLTQIFKINDIGHVTIAYMEVPCCTGLLRIIDKAIEAAKVDIALTKIQIGINGNILGVI